MISAPFKSPRSVTIGTLNCVFVTASETGRRRIDSGAGVPSDGCNVVEGVDAPDVLDAGADTCDSRSS